MGALVDAIVALAVFAFSLIFRVGVWIVTGLFNLTLTVLDWFVRLCSKLFRFLWRKIKERYFNKPSHTPYISDTPYLIDAPSKDGKYDNKPSTEAFNVSYTMTDNNTYTYTMRG